MATVLDILTRAFRKIGVVANDEPLTANDAQAGLEAFNAMMHGLAAHGADPGHITNVTTDTFAYPARLEEAVVYVLADRLAPDYATQAPAARVHYNTLQAYFLQVPKVTPPLSMLRTPTGRRWGDTWQN
jgi:hypothetical protein